MKQIIDLAAGTVRHEPLTADEVTQRAVDEQAHLTQKQEHADHIRFKALKEILLDKRIRGESPTGPELAEYNQLRNRT
jgi:hypothetical protein